MAYVNNYFLIRFYWEVLPESKLPPLGEVARRADRGNCMYSLRCSMKIEPVPRARQLKDLFRPFGAPSPGMPRQDFDDCISNPFIKRYKEDTEVFTMIIRNILAGMLCAVMLLTVTMTQAFAASPINQDGYYKGIRLAGKVKVVDYNADIKVKSVSSFPDLRVKAVEHFPDDIGEWQFVDYGEDFTIQYVDSFPDIKIQFVEHWPGIA